MPSSDWMRLIEEACSAEDRVLSNLLITDLHYQLSEALAEKLGRSAGANFHSWAVWGSRKAGETIRQEDLSSAVHNATVTAGVVGAFTGVTVGVMAGRKLRWRSDFSAALGGIAGCICGSWAGRTIAIHSREEASRLILLGNQTVLRDIGEQSARFLDLLESGAALEARAKFFAGLRPGPTEENGQDRLAIAFRSYLAAFDADNLPAKREAMIAGNCSIVYHEHIRLEPFIRQSMPWIVRRCATQRMMTFQVGDRQLKVANDVPGVYQRTGARDWTKIEERMRYVFALFRKFHDVPDVFLKP